MLVRKGCNKKQHEHRDMKCYMNFRIVCNRFCIKLFNVQVGGCRKGDRGSKRVEAAPLHGVAMEPEFGKEEHRTDTATCAPPCCAVLQLLSSFGRAGELWWCSGPPNLSQLHKTSGKKSGIKKKRGMHKAFSK